MAWFLLQSCMAAMQPAMLKKAPAMPSAPNVVVAIMAVEGLHWFNAYIIASKSDVLPFPGHELVDVTLHVALHTLMLGVATFNLKGRQLFALVLLRFALEAGFALFDAHFDDRVYGRRRGPQLVSAPDLPGTCGYVLGELYITILAAFLDLAARPKLTKKDAEQQLQDSRRESCCAVPALGKAWGVLKRNKVVQVLLSNTGGVRWVLLFHWAYLIVADIYLRSKVMAWFHAAHAMNMMVPLVVMPLCAAMAH